MIDAKTQNVIGSSPLSGILVHCADVQCPTHRKPLRLTISVEKVDRFLADMRKQIGILQSEMANLRLVRTQLVRYQQENPDDQAAKP